jgi:hypothetical protein
MMLSSSIKIESPPRREQRNENYCESESECVNENVSIIESFESKFAIRGEMKAASSRSQTNEFKSLTN